MYSAADWSTRRVNSSAAVGDGAWSGSTTSEHAYEAVARRGRGALGRDRRTSPAEEHALRRRLAELEEARARRHWQNLHEAEAKTSERPATTETSP